MKRASSGVSAAQAQAHVNRDAVIVEKHDVEVGHVAAVLPAEDAAQGRCAERGASFQPSVTSMPLIRWTIRSPPTPVPYSFQQRQRAKRYWVEGDLGSIVEPGVPIEILRREIERRRIFPGAGGIVAAEGELDHFDVADGARLVQFAGLGAEHAELTRCEPICTMRLFFCAASTMSTALGRGVRHRLLAVNVLARVAGVDHDAPVPVIGNGGDDAVDILAVEQFLIAARGGQVGIAGDLAGQRVAAVVEIGGAHALDAGHGDGVRQQAGALHADADDAEANAIAGRRRPRQRLGFEQDGLGRPAGRRLPPRFARKNERRERIRFMRIPPNGLTAACFQCCYFLSGLMATSLKNTMSLSL